MIYQFLSPNLSIIVLSENADPAKSFTRQINKLRGIDIICDYMPGYLKLLDCLLYTPVPGPRD